MNSAVRYTLRAVQPAAHLFEVTLHLAEPDPAGQVFSLPAWIPGSYMIREFAKNIVSLSAKAGGKPVEAYKRDKHTWQLPAGVTGAVVVHHLPRPSATIAAAVAIWASVGWWVE